MRLLRAIREHLDHHVKAIFKFLGFFGIKIRADVEDAEYDPGEDRYGMGRMYDNGQGPDEPDLESRKPIVGSFESIRDVLNTIDALYKEELHRPHGADNTGTAILLRKSLLNGWTATDMRRWLRISPEWDGRHPGLQVADDEHMERHDHGPNDDLPWPRPEVVTTLGNREAKGFSRLERKMFADDNGVYPAIGATYMYAVRSAEVDEARLIRNLDWLSQNGCNYIRILLMVGTPPYWSFEIKPRSWDAYHRVMELAWERRMRTQPVIFADAENSMPSLADREKFAEEVAQFCNDRREMVQFIEVANEAELNGVRMDELTRYCEILSKSTDIPFAASSPTGSHEEIDGLERLYRDHGCRSPIATPHFDRTEWEDGYRIIRQPWHYQYAGDSSYMPGVFVNNEPAGFGPNSGGMSIPEHFGMGALYTFLSGGAAFCFHSIHGVKGSDRANENEFDFSDMPRGDEMWESIRSLVANVPTNIANGNSANHHWTNPQHPLEPTLNEQIWPDNSRNGLVRAFAQGFGPEWYVGLLGIRGSVEFAPNRDVDATLYHPISGNVVWNRPISQGETVTVEQDGETRSYLLKTVDS
jgi:hypothetical protein